ncbi:hypothetical protein Peur_014086 [Populus x canadensis]
MGQDYVKRMEADSNTFRKQRGSYNEVVVKVIFSGAYVFQGAACPGTFQEAAVIAGYALDRCSPKSTSYHDSSICGFYFLSLSSLRL